MSKKITLKMEKFCQEYTSNGGNASAAYRTAYDTEKMKAETIHREASRLLNNHHVATRINTICLEHGKKYVITRDFLTSKLISVLDSEQAAQSPYLINRVCMDLARLHGLLAERKATNNMRNFTSMPTVTIDSAALGFDVG